MDTILSQWQEALDPYVGIATLMPLAFLFLPWAVARWRERDRTLESVKPQGGRPGAFRVALLGAVLVFLVVLVAGGMTVWSMGGKLDSLPWPWWLPKEKGLGFIVLTVASFLTGMMYRTLRWETVDAHIDVESGHPNTPADSECSPGEDAGRTSLVHGAGRAPTT
jgi:hypothetical protein